MPQTKVRRLTTQYSRGRMKVVHRTAAAILVAAACMIGVWNVAATGTAAAQELSLFRIGTGGTGGTYYPIAGLVAQAISNPSGTCESEEPCGVPGLVAVAQSSSGSVSNVKDIASGRIESGFVQSDVAFWAYTGVNEFEEEGRQGALRAIANLYPESFHIVVRRDGGIKTVADLAGKRVALDEVGSGTLVGARLILEAFGLTEETIEVTYLKSDDAIEKLVAGELDAFFLIAGYPVRALQWANENTDIDLVPITGTAVDALVLKNPFLHVDKIPAGVYAGVGETETLSVAAQWITREDVSAETVYGILQALWRSDSRRLLDRGHAKGRVIRLETALEGIGIPLHEGALRFYREIGLIRRGNGGADRQPT